MATTSTTSSAPAPKTFKVGIIIGSTRAVRAGPQITTFIHQTISSHIAAHPPAVPTTLELIDIAALALPLSSEPGVPSQIHSAAGYTHEHTRAWSQRIAALDAFVFVTPQYNWGIPAGLKNAVDHLFHEWKGKPAAVVAYGGHGGDKAAAALLLVLGGGIGMRVVPEPVCLAFPGREFLVRAAGGRELGLDGNGGEGVWAERRGDVVKAWEELVGLLVATD